MAACDHQFLELCDGSGGIEAFRTGDGAIHEGVTTIQPERTLKRVESFTGDLIAAIDEPIFRLGRP